MYVAVQVPRRIIVKGRLLAQAANYMHRSHCSSGDLYICMYIHTYVDAYVLVILAFSRVRIAMCTFRCEH